MVVLVELGRAEVEIALSGLLVEEGILKHDVLLEGLPCAHEGMSDIDAVFKRGLLEELEDLLHIVVFDLGYCGFDPSSLHGFSVRPPEHHLLVGLLARQFRSPDAVLDVAGQEVDWPLRVALVVGDVDDLLHLIGHLNVDLLRLLQLLYLPLLLLLQQLSPHVGVSELQRADDAAVMAVIE